MGVNVARRHSIAGPARAAMPFTSTQAPLAYLLLPQRDTKGRKEFLVLLLISSVPYVPFCG
jgi:hypothetical protein